MRSPTERVGRIEWRGLVDALLWLILGLRGRRVVRRRCLLLRWGLRWCVVRLLGGVQFGLAGQPGLRRRLDSLWWLRLVLWLLPRGQRGLLGVR